MSCISLDDSSEVALLKHLTILDLSCNRLTDLSGLSNLVLLTDLKLSENMITDLDPIKHLTNLKKIDVSSNCIKELNFENVQYNQLIDAQFSKNQISIVSGMNVLSELQSFNLSKCV